MICYTESDNFFVAIVESARKSFFGTTGSAVFDSVFISGLGVFA